MVKQIPTAVFPGKNAEPQTTTALVDTQRRITPEWRRWTEFVDVTIRRFARFFTFLALEDTPDSYSGAALEGVRVKADETGLEFFALSSAGARGFGLNTTNLFSAGEELGACVFEDDITFPSATRSYYVTSEVAATGIATAKIYERNAGVETQVGTIVWSAGGTVATVTWTPNPYTLIAGRKLKVYAPSPRDATLANVTGEVPGDLS
jgi:hypothetical protein